MFQAGVAIVERDAPIEGLIDLYFGASEAEPACLLGNLEASALPLHDVVVTNHALVHQAADTIEDLRSSTPRGFFFARLPSETAGVVGVEHAQHRVGRVLERRSRQTQDTGDELFQDVPRTRLTNLFLPTVCGQFRL